MRGLTVLGPGSAYGEPIVPSTVFLLSSMESDVDWLVRNLARGARNSIFLQYESTAVVRESFVFLPSPTRARQTRGALRPGLLLPCRTKVLLSVQYGCDSNAAQRAPTVLIDFAIG